MNKPVHDKVHDERVHPESINCAVCKKCWLIVLGKLRGKCIHGGPYRGYVEVEDVES